MFSFSAAILVVAAISLFVAHSHPYSDYSHIDAKSRPFYRTAAKECQLLSSAKVDIWPGHGVQMNRYACNAKLFSPEALQNAGVQSHEFTSNIEVVLFVEKTWLFQKALLGDYSWYEYFQVVYSSIDGHPSVLLQQAREGSSGFSDWILVTAMPNGGIGAAKPPEDEHLNTVHLAPSDVP